LLASSANAQRRGLEVPEKQLHVVDSDGPALVFSSNSADRAGRYEAAAENANDERAKAQSLRDAAAAAEKSAQDADKKAASFDQQLTKLNREEGHWTLGANVTGAFGIGAAGALAMGVATRGVLGGVPQSSPAGSAALALVGLLGGMWLGQTHPRAGASLAAASLTLGWLGFTDSTPYYGAGLARR